MALAASRTKKTRYSKMAKKIKINEKVKDSNRPKASKGLKI